MIKLTRMEIVELARYTGLTCFDPDAGEDPEEEFRIERCPAEGLRFIEDDDTSPRHHFRYVASPARFPGFDGCFPLGDELQAPVQWPQEARP